jgi:hypothetical protein
MNPAFALSPVTGLALNDTYNSDKVVFELKLLSIRAPQAVRTIAVLPHLDGSILATSRVEFAVG